MKKLLLIAGLFSATASFAQHYYIPVQEVNVNDTAFKYHPATLDIDFAGLDASFDTALYKVVTTFEEDAVNDPHYIYKKTTTESVIKIPLSVSRMAFSKDGTINEQVMNAVLSGFKLMLKPKDP